MKKEKKKTNEEKKRWEQGEGEGGRKVRDARMNGRGNRRLKGGMKGKRIES